MNPRLLQYCLIYTSLKPLERVKWSQNTQILNNQQVKWSQEIETNESKVANESQTNEAKFWKKLTTLSKVVNESQTNENHVMTKQRLKQIRSM